MISETWQFTLLVFLFIEKSHLFYHDSSWNGEKNTNENKVSWKNALKYNIFFTFGFEILLDFYG